MADAGEAIGLRIFGKLDAGCSSSDTKQEMPDMIWNDLDDLLRSSQGHGMDRARELLLLARP